MLIDRPGDPGPSGATTTNGLADGFAFGLTLVVLIANIVVARQQFRSVRTRLAQRWANQQESSDL
jgi:hypothetical protein